MKAWLCWILLLVVVLLYIASPLDLIPEFLVGPAGLMEDLLLIGVLIWVFTAKRPGESPGDFYRRHRNYRRPSSGREGDDKREREEPSDDAERDPFKILGVEPGASSDEIKAAYRRAVAKYHPDKVTHLGREFQDLAHRKLVAIQRAYDAVMKK